MSTEATCSHILFKGWDHFGCGPWKMVGRIPSRWRKVRDGVVRNGDKRLMATPEGIKISKRKRKKGEIGDQLIPCHWTPVESENIGKKVKTFFYVIHRANSAISGI